ncbi:MAG TPA: hypothetical protein VNO52_00325 [Methylomirabilota bacterium]|nr:hypothetical protein [Methylomirabilota bacterium]
MATNTGDLKNRKQTTARVWFKRTGASAFVELGDVAKYKKSDDKSYSDIKASQKGFKRLNAKLLNSVTLQWQFTLNEQLTEVMRLLGLATKAADTVQSSATGQSETFNGTTKGATYFLSKRDVSSVVMTTPSGKTEGVDYAVEAGIGAITILPAGTIADGANVTITYNCNAVTLENYTSLKETRVTGTFKVAEYDQFSEVPREIHDFDGQIWVSNQGENDGEKPTEVEVTILVTSPTPTNQKRVD